MDSSDHDGLHNITSVETADGPELHSEGGFYVQSFFSKELSGKDWLRFVNSVKGMIRSSIEYKLFISGCKIDLDLNNCSFLGNIIGEDKVDIEIHHCPLTLHDIIEIVADHMLSQGDTITTMTVAHEVLAAHFMGLVGILPLSETIHDLVHSGKVTVSMSQIYGNVGGFLRAYVGGIDEETLSKILLAIELSKRGELVPEGTLEFSTPEVRVDGEPLTLDDVIAALTEAISRESKDTGRG